MVQAGVSSLRAYLPDEKIWLLFENKIPRHILKNYFEAVKTLYLHSVLNVEEISILFGIIKPGSVNLYFSAELEKKVRYFSQYDDPDGLITSINEVVFSKKENASLAFKLNYRMRSKSPQRRKWVALYFCLVLYCLQ